MFSSSDPSELPQLRKELTGAGGIQVGSAEGICNHPLHLSKLFGTIFTHFADTNTNLVTQRLSA